MEGSKDEIKQLAEFTNKQFEETKNSIDEERNKLATDLRAEMKKLKEEIEDVKEYQRRNNLEIHGVPVKPNEDLYEIVIGIGALLDTGIQHRDIDVVHRLPTRKEGEDKPILVRFTNRWMKEKILNAKRKARNLTLFNIGMAPQNKDKNIFINEHLTLNAQALFKRARHLKTKGHFKYAWSRGGKIFLKKTETSKAILINNEIQMKTMERQCGESQ